MFGNRCRTGTAAAILCLGLAFSGIGAVDPNTTAGAPLRGSGTSAHADLLCTDCHDSHGDTGNLVTIRESIDTPFSGPRDVLFLALAGPNSYADGDAIYDGLCEVCHTITTFHRNDGSGDPGHWAARDCSTCHDHWNGYGLVDCATVTWYRDNDGDGFGIPGDTLTGCTQPPGYRLEGGDCDDVDPSIHPGAPETNDGKDNQCPGDPGFGLIDELAPTCGFLTPGDRGEFSCVGQPGATAYELVVSLDAEFQSGCSTTGSAVPTWSVPDPASGAWFYLARATAPNAGSWGRMTSGERSPVCP